MDTRVFFFFWEGVIKTKNFLSRRKTRNFINVSLSNQLVEQNVVVVEYHPH